MKDKNFESHIIGALLGLACGDALGAPAEFKDKAYVEKKWGTLTEMVGGGGWEPGEWTDDTGMALCVAEGILSSPADPVEEIGKRFLEWRKTAKDVGTTISAALSGYQGDWPQAAQSTPHAKSGKAAGNGSLMRTLPVALAYANISQMLRQSARISSMTHWDAQAQACCAVYCLWVWEMPKWHSLSKSWKSALEKGRTLADRIGPPDTVGTTSLSAEFWQRLEAIESLRYKDLQPSGYAGYVVECLEAAAWCALHGESLEDTIIKAVNLAGEADTMAAVAGGIAGAYWGKEAIPARWLDKLHQREKLEQTARQLLNLRRHLETYSAAGLKHKPFEHNQVAERVLAGRNPLTACDVDELCALGVTHILDLRQPKEWSDKGRFGAEALEEIERRGLNRLHLEVTDMGAPTDQALDSACRFIDEALADPQARVYVHCRAGMERTAAVLVAYHARHHGVSYDDALAKLREGRPIFKLYGDQEPAVRKWLKNAAESIKEETKLALEQGSMELNASVFIADGIPMTFEQYKAYRLKEHDEEEAEKQAAKAWGEGHRQMLVDDEAAYASRRAEWTVEFAMYAAGIAKSPSPGAVRVDGQVKASMAERVLLLWNGVTQSAGLHDEERRLRERLSEAAKNYDWKETLAILSENSRLVNVTRPDGASLYAPLHQAAHGGAPLNVVKQLLTVGAWRTLQNAKGERPVDVAMRQGHEHLFSILKPRYKRQVPLGILLKIQHHLHDLIRTRTNGLPYAKGLRLPELDPLLEYSDAEVWFNVPKLRYWLESEGVNAKLVVESRCRDSVGNETHQRHEITSGGSQLVD